jgi:hypothetical protein
MYTYVSKCKNDKIKGEKGKKKTVLTALHLPFIPTPLLSTKFVSVTFILQRSSLFPTSCYGSVMDLWQRQECVYSMRRLQKLSPTFETIKARVYYTLKENSTLSTIHPV